MRCPGVRDLPPTMRPGAPALAGTCPTFLVTPGGGGIDSTLAPGMIRWRVVDDVLVTGTAAMLPSAWGTILTEEELVELVCGTYPGGGVAPEVLLISWPVRSRKTSENLVGEPSSGMILVVVV